MILAGGELLLVATILGRIFGAGWGNLVKLDRARKV